ncbi:hypothetical protein EDD99_6294 [Streptomyces sp. 846.5]|nr:hypothetical protein [Streptomyces sp. 846.5]TDT98081.1 hypothetical protein EDD99_6294 [Streptomyces sp. 846.5]
MSQRNERFRESLRGLAASAAGEPPLSGAELRRLAERRRRRRLLAVPALAVSGLLVGGTAFAITGALGSAPQAVPPVSGGTPSASASGIASAAPDPARSADPRASATPSRSARPVVPSGSGSPTSAGPSASATSAVPDPGQTVGCVTARAGETLVRLYSLQLPGVLSTGVDALMYAVPVTCVRGELVPGGGAQWLHVLTDAVVTTTAPLSTGTGSSVNTLAAVASSLVLHPAPLFGIHKDAQGRVDRLDQVATGS